MHPLNGALSNKRESVISRIKRLLILRYCLGHSAFMRWPMPAAGTTSQRDGLYMIARTMFGEVTGVYFPGMPVARDGHSQAHMDVLVAFHRKDNPGTSNSRTNTRRPERKSRLRELAQDTYGHVPPRLPARYEDSAPPHKAGHYAPPTRHSQPAAQQSPSPTSKPAQSYPPRPTGEPAAGESALPEWPKAFSCQISSENNQVYRKSRRSSIDLIVD